MHRATLLVLAVVAGAQTMRTAAQSTMSWPTGRVLPYALDSGLVRSEAGPAKAAFAAPVHVPGAAWLRLHFEVAELAPGSVIRMTSTRDGQVQTLDAAEVARWGFSSAYFNGDTVQVQLMPAPGAGSSRIVIDRLTVPAVAEPSQTAGGSGACGVCGTDDRTPTSETWTGRLLPAGCTASVFDESSCLVSAGHCVTSGMVVQFEVPDSNADCTLNHPPVENQFPIIAGESVSGGVGNDWAVLVPGPNASGELPFDRFGALRPIGKIPPPGAQASVTGYGIDTACTRSQTQQWHQGPIVGATAAALHWQIDIRAGNSGSALLVDGQIVGIVTHCNPEWCPPAPNFATRIDLPSFAAARAAACDPNLAFTLPDGRPDVVAPAGGTSVRVHVGAGTASPMASTGLLHLRVDEGPFWSLPMSELAPNEYEAVFPSVPCGALVGYYLSAETTDGQTMTFPAPGPDDHWQAIAAERLTTVFVDDFESDQGWSIAGSATDGAWERGAPIPHVTCNRGNPDSDADGSGQCFVTDNSADDQCNSDVDAGTTVLTSPIIDVGDPTSMLRYWRWFDNTGAGQGSGAFQDVFTVEASGDGGATWVIIETVGPVGLDADGGWHQQTVRPSDLVAGSAFRVRFSAADTDPQSVVEAAVDLVEMVRPECGLACPWDLDGSGAVDTFDFLDLLAQWGGPGPADFDDTGSVDTADLLDLLARWGACP